MISSVVGFLHIRAVHIFYILESVGWLGSLVLYEASTCRKKRKLGKRCEDYKYYWVTVVTQQKKKIPTFWSSYLTYLAGDVHNSFVNRAHVDWQVQWHCTEKAPDEFTVQT